MKLSSLLIHREAFAADKGVLVTIHLLPTVICVLSAARVEKEEVQELILASCSMLLRLRGGSG